MARTQRRLSEFRRQIMVWAVIMLGSCAAVLVVATVLTGRTLFLVFALVLAALAVSYGASLIRDNQLKRDAARAEAGR